MSMKPMLAATVDTVDDLDYPVLASAKFDGIRALVLNGVVVSRSLKPIPNLHVQKLFGNPKYNGLDGELIVDSPTATDVFQVTTSGVMKIEGKPNVKFYVFDDYTHTDMPFGHRMLYTSTRVNGEPNARMSHAPTLRSWYPGLHPDIIMVKHTMVKNSRDMRSLENSFYDRGFEGVMVRNPVGLYKHGRSTLRQGWLLKLKRFTDSEAVIIGVRELKSNNNEAKINNLGHKERSHKKDGMVGQRTLGALMVKDIKTDIEFCLGTGFSQQLREAIWEEQEELVGKIVKYKYQKVGVKEKPRFPVFLGFRDTRDL